MTSGYGRGSGFLPLRQHYYWPSTKHVGDCQVCGNTEDHPIHPRWTQEELDEARAKAEKMSARLRELVIE